MQLIPLLLVFFTASITAHPIRDTGAEKLTSRINTNSPGNFGFVSTYPNNDCSGKTTNQ
jgi:hypothetical protein